jgi:hypothetical protein
MDIKTTSAIYNAKNHFHENHDDFDLFLISLLSNDEISNTVLDILINHVPSVYDIRSSFKYGNVDLSLTRNQLDNIRSTLLSNGKVAAIRLCREYSGCGLKEAKDFVEGF